MSRPTGWHPAYVVATTVRALRSRGTKLRLDLPDGGDTPLLAG